MTDRTTSQMIVDLLRKLDYPQLEAVADKIYYLKLALREKAISEIKEF